MTVKRVILAEYFTAEDSTLLFIVRPDFEEPHVVEIKTPLDEVRRFVAANFGVAEGVRDLDMDEWQTRFGPFVEPILPWTDEGDVIWLVPHGVLHYLPLHALKVEGRYLIERNPICYTPSASVMKYCQAKRKRRLEKALVLGDSLNNLRYAREEALTLAKLLNTIPYLGGQATKSLVKKKLEEEQNDLDVLHFACHGYFHPYQALKSGIILAPEQSGDSGERDEERWNLTAEEIFGMETRVDLVTLSACESGVNEHRPGDELVGLTRALLYAGTPSVIVSLWSVDDLSTGMLMRHFYQELQKSSEEGDGPPVSKVEALQVAQQYVRNLTSQHVVDYCDQRLAELTMPEDADRAISLKLSRANAQVIASDLKSAVATYREIHGQFGTSVNEQDKKLDAQIAKTLDRIEFIKDEAESEPLINYDVKPFEHIYYWAPFVLVGDWK